MSDSGKYLEKVIMVPQHSSEFEFKLVEFLGDGFMGEVYRGVELINNQNMLEQVFKFPKSKEFFPHMKHAARVMEKIKSHPNIVDFKGYFECRELEAPCLRFEYLKGKDLGTYISDKKKEKNGIDPNETIKIVFQILDAIEYVHNLKEPVVHTDLTPSNIRIMENGLVKVMDFGIAQIIKEVDNSKFQEMIKTREPKYYSKPDHREEGGGVLTNNTEYVAPEVKNQGRFTPQCDIYSITKILHFCTTGQDVGAEGIAFDILEEKGWGGIGKIIRIGIKTDLNARFKTVGDLRKAINESMEKRKIPISNETDVKPKATETDEFTFPFKETKPTLPPTSVFEPPEKISTPKKPKKEPPIAVGFLILAFIIAIMLFYFATQKEGNKNQRTRKVTPLVVDIKSNENKSNPGEEGYTSRSTQLAPKLVNDKEKEEKERIEEINRQYKSSLRDISNAIVNKNYSKAKAIIESLKKIKVTNDLFRFENQVEAKLGEEEKKENEYQTYLKVAQAYIDSGNYEKAEEVLQNAEEIKMDEDLENLKENLKIARENAMNSYKEYLKNAKLNFQFGNFEEALSQINRAKKFDSTEELKKLENDISAKKREKQINEFKKKEDDDAYLKAVRGDEIWDYEEYSSKYPNGYHITEAKNKIEKKSKILIPKVSPPQLIKEVKPIYPPEAKKQGIIGDVTIDAITDTDGKVVTAIVISGPEVLRSAALRAIKQWIYKPYYMNNKPLRVRFTVKVTFTMDHE